MAAWRCVCSREFHDPEQFQTHLASCPDALHEGRNRWSRHQIDQVRPPSERCKLIDRQPPSGPGSGWGTGCLWWAGHDGDCKMGAVPEACLKPDPATVPRKDHR